MDADSLTRNLLRCVRILREVRVSLLPNVSFLLTRLICAAIAVAIGVLSTVSVVPDADAIPAFARKYNVTCTVCHTREPRLNTFGERFLENGYQMPGTEDGGIVGKKKLGDVTLPDVTDYLAFRMRANAVSMFNVDEQDADTGPKDRTLLGSPRNFTLLGAGTITNNVGFFADTSDRAVITLNNLGMHNLAHLRIGEFDPSAFYSHSTRRQQLGIVTAKLGGASSLMLAPAAFAAKFSGLHDRHGALIDPSTPSLFNTESEVGIDIHGRPFGDWFLYQVGVLNGEGEGTSDSNNSKDWYVMGRLDWAQSNLFSANISGFSYMGTNNATIAAAGAPGHDADWNRYGVAATIRYQMFDVYGSYTIDRISGLSEATEAVFDTSASGLTLQADVIVTDRLLMSAQYNNLDGGGDRSMRLRQSVLGLQAKYFLRSNIAIFVRNDLNLRSAEESPPVHHAFRHALLSGLALVF